MAKDAERFIQLTRQPGTADGELVLRGAPGEVRFAPYKVISHVPGVRPEPVMSQLTGKMVSRGVGS